MDVEKVILLVKYHEAIYDASSPTNTMGYLCLYLEYFSLEEHLSYLVQAMKQYGGVEVLSPLFSQSLLYGGRMVSFTPQPLSPCRANRRFPLDMRLSGPRWTLSRR
jgi:hypothetical protein